MYICVCVILSNLVSLSLACTCYKNCNSQGRCYLQLSVILSTAILTLVGRIADHSRKRLIPREFQRKSRLGDKHRLQKTSRLSQMSVFLVHTCCRNPRLSVPEKSQILTTLMTSEKQAL